MGRICIYIRMKNSFLVQHVILKVPDFVMNVNDFVGVYGGKYIFLALARFVKPVAVFLR